MQNVSLNKSSTSTKSMRNIVVDFNEILTKERIFPIMEIFLFNNLKY